MKGRLTKIVSGFAIFGVVFIACFVYAYYIEPNRLVVNHSTIKIKNWEHEFDGLKIVLIGDIHGGSKRVTEEKIRKVVAKVNEQNADLVVLLGDYVSQNHENKLARERSLKMPIETVAANLSGISAKYGVFAVLGNHDGWYGDDKVSAELTRVGYRVLNGNVALIERNGKRIRLLGLKDHLHVNDWKEYASNAKQLLAASEGTGDVIVLQHSPDVLPIISGDLLISNDLKLMLAAHTHGGQIWLPVLGYPIIPSSYGQKYAAGHVKDVGLDMFVTTGIGTSILPFRFMVPPEIAVLTIRTD